MGLAELSNLDRTLDGFLTSEIAISRESRSTASGSHNYLRQVLRGKEDTDSNFPQLLDGADFIGGSFARHTKIWPLDDIDVFIPLDGGGLNYVNALRTSLPFEVVTGGKYSRLNLSQWDDNGYVNSRWILDYFKQSVETTYPRSQVSVDKHCVNLGTTVEATADSDGIGFDIVPCFLLRPSDGSADFYLVPNGNGGWMRSNPENDRIICTALHSFHNGTFRKAVRLIKYWAKNQINPTLPSYYIELAIMKRFMELRAQNISIGFTIQAFAIAFTALRDAISAGSLSSLTIGAPAVTAPQLQEIQMNILSGDTTRSQQAFFLANSSGDEANARINLNTIFLSGFFA